MDFKKPKTDEIQYLLEDVIKDCREKFFRTIENRCMYDKQLTNMENKDVNNLTITHG